MCTAFCETFCCFLVRFRDSCTDRYNENDSQDDSEKMPPRPRPPDLYSWNPQATYAAGASMVQPWPAPWNLQPPTAPHTTNSQLSPSSPHYPRYSVKSSLQQQQVGHARPTTAWPEAADIQQPRHIITQQPKRKPLPIYLPPPPIYSPSIYSPPPPPTSRYQYTSSQDRAPKPPTREFISISPPPPPLPRKNSNYRPATHKRRKEIPAPLPAGFHLISPTKNTHYRVYTQKPRLERTFPQPQPLPLADPNSPSQKSHHINIHPSKRDNRPLAQPPQHFDPSKTDHSSRTSRTPKSHKSPRRPKTPKTPKSPKSPRKPQPLHPRIHPATASLHARILRARYEAERSEALFSPSHHISHQSSSIHATDFPLPPLQTARIETVPSRPGLTRTYVSYSRPLRPRLALPIVSHSPSIYSQPGLSSLPGLSSPPGLSSLPGLSSQPGLSSPPAVPPKPPKIPTTAPVAQQQERGVRRSAVPQPLCVPSRARQGTGERMRLLEGVLEARGIIGIEGVGKGEMGKEMEGGEGMEGKGIVLEQEQGGGAWMFGGRGWVRVS